MKKIDVFIIDDNGTQIFCIYEETAKAEAEARNKNYLTTKLKENVFENMLKDKAFFDTDLYFERNKEEEQQTTDTKPAEQPTDTEKLLQMLEEMRSVLDSLRAENQQLKSRPRFSIEQAKEMHDRKQQLTRHKAIFEKAKENIVGALKEFDNIIEFQENETFRLVMYYLDHQTQKGKELFSIATNGVIINTMKYVKNEVLNKIADIEFQISEIEKTFI